MVRNKFIRSDGSVIDSSVIVSCKYSDQTNSSNNLTVGDATASSVEIELRNPDIPISKGESLVYYQIEDDDETLVGTFYAEAPTILTKNTCRVIAYDGIAKLSVDFSEWLSNNQALFPMTVRQLAQYACDIAGVTFTRDTFDNEDINIPAFYAQGVTARQIISWAAQVAGKFVRCGTLGIIEFAWYSASEITISANSGADLIYFQDRLVAQNYQTDTIDRVQFKQEANDVGVIYPPDASGNTFSISNNGLAALLDSSTISDIAKSLYEKLRYITYTPLEVLVKRTGIVRAGDIISVVDADGNSVSTYVMSVYLDSSGTLITSTGDKSYGDKAAVSSEQFKDIPGKILTLQKSVDGLKIENADTSGKLANLSLDVNGLKTQVSNNSSQISKIEQSAEAIDVKVQDIIDNGVDKLSTEFGLTIDGSCVDIHRAGEQMHNSLDETGMYVRRGNEIMLQANNEGVIATDVTVRNYLIIGQHARFEDYSNGADAKRTACFWI